MGGGDRSKLASSPSHAVPLDLVDDPTETLVIAGATQPDPVVHLRLREAWRRK